MLVNVSRERLWTNLQREQAKRKDDQALELVDKCLLWFIGGCMLLVLIAIYGW